jgi:hypothetical protein
MTHKETRKLIFLENQIYLVTGYDIFEGDWYLWLYHGKYFLQQANKLTGFDESVKHSCFKVLASTQHLGGCSALLDNVQIEALLNRDKVTLQDLIDKRNYPERYDAIRQQYQYSEQDIKDIVEEFREVLEIELRNANRSVWDAEIEMLTSFVMGGGLIPVGQVGGKGNTRYETHTPLITQGYIKILKLT